MNLDVNEKVFKIWKKFSGKEEYIVNFKNLVNKNKDNQKLTGKDPLNDLCPITYKKDEYTKPEGKEYRFLFTGFNPSFNEKHYKKCKKNDREIIEDPYKFFRFDKNKIELDQEIIDVDYSLRNKDSDNLKGNSYEDKKGKQQNKNYYTTYFDRLKEFIEKDIFKDRDVSDRLHHVHIDPFFIRGTNQDQARTILMIDKKNKWETEEDGFAENQLKLFEEMIKSYDPTHIIILNATASHILSKRWKSNYDEKNTDTSFKFKEYIVVCGGMLFGAGGMDTYSRERFAQEIRKHVFKKN